MSSNAGGSRQKNCNACVKSKRRCDRRQPCGRCTKQRYPCIYGGPGAILGDSADAPFRLDYLADPTANSDTFMPAPNAPSATLGTDIDMTYNGTLQLNNDFSSLFAPMPENSGFLADSWLSQFTRESSIPREKTLIRKDYSKMAPMCDEYAPWQLADPSTKAAFSLNAFKRFHFNFAQNSGTIYMHPYLYKDNMPRCMLQAFSVCSLYANQKASNRGVVLRVLHDNIVDLKTAASNTALVPQEKLARVHALMFYQTIRMLDGDVTLGQQAEDDMALLESWNKDLCKVKDNLDDLASKEKVASEHPPESWERWIFAESLRRTYIMCICIQKFWGMLKTRLKATDIGNWESVCRWTLSRPIFVCVSRCTETVSLVLTDSSHLWNARNSFEFFQAWKEKPLYIISSFGFTDFLETGTGDDLDDFAFFILTLYFGVNEIKTFCHETSGRLLTLP